MSPLQRGGYLANILFNWVYVNYSCCHKLTGRRCVMLQAMFWLWSWFLWYLRVSPDNPPVKSLSVSLTDFCGRISTRPSSTPTTSATGTETLITQITHSTSFSGHASLHKMNRIFKPLKKNVDLPHNILLIIAGVKAHVEWIIAASHLAVPMPGLF